MHPDQRAMTVFRLTNYQYAIDRHTGGQVREEMFASPLSQSAGEELDFAELATPDARIPLHGRVYLTAGQRQGNWPHQVEVQAWP